MAEKVNSAGVERANIAIFESVISAWVERVNSALIERMNNAWVYRESSEWLKKGEQYLVEKVDGVQYRCLWAQNSTWIEMWTVYGLRE